MDVYEILEDIAKDKPGMTRDEISDSNIDDLFPVEAGERQLEPLYKLCNYIDANLPDEYSTEIGEPEKGSDHVDFSLVKTLVDKEEQSGQHNVKYKSTLKVTIGIVDLEGFEESFSFRGVREILEYVYGAYESISEYAINNNVDK
ncbi:hypothetical protein ACFL6I_26455 [candidate division KSB1 bacterium]